MRNTTPRLIAILIVLGGLLGVAPAYAQSTRTFVSGAGNDANPCTVVAPCRTLQHAHDATVPNGEIDVLDPAGYGSLTISKAITIQGQGWAKSATIQINADAGDRITLRGLILEGMGSTSSGIDFQAGGTLDVQDCFIHNYTTAGILFAPTNTQTGGTFLNMANTRVTGTQNGPGIKIANAVSGTFVEGFLDHVSIDGNLGDGMNVVGADIVVQNSTIVGNNIAGINLPGPLSTLVHLSNTVVYLNANASFVQTGGDIVTLHDNAVDSGSAPLGEANLE